MGQKFLPGDILMRLNLWGQLWRITSYSVCTCHYTVAARRICHLLQWHFILSLHIRGTGHPPSSTGPPRAAEDHNQPEWILSPSQSHHNICTSGGKRLESSRSDAVTLSPHSYWDRPCGCQHCWPCPYNTKYMQELFSPNTCLLLPHSLWILPQIPRFPLFPSSLLSLKSPVAPVPFFLSCQGQFIVLISDELAV